MSGHQEKTENHTFSICISRFLMLSEGKFFQEMQSILIWLEHKYSLRNANQLGKILQKNILYRSFVLHMGETGIIAWWDIYYVPHTGLSMVSVLALPSSTKAPLVIFFISTGMSILLYIASIFSRHHVHVVLLNMHRCVWTGQYGLIVTLPVIYCKQNTDNKTRDRKSIWCQTN